MLADELHPCAEIGEVEAAACDRDRDWIGRVETEKPDARFVSDGHIRPDIQFQEC
jgi:hypothetical protein